MGTGDCCSGEGADGENSYDLFLGQILEEDEGVGVAKLSIVFDLGIEIAAGFLRTNFCFYGTSSLGG